MFFIHPWIVIGCVFFSASLIGRSILVKALEIIQKFYQLEVIYYGLRRCGVCSRADFVLLFRCKFFGDIKPKAVTKNVSESGVFDGSAWVVFLSGAGYAVGEKEAQEQSG